MSAASDSLVWLADQIDLDRGIRQVDAARIEVYTREGTPIRIPVRLVDSFPDRMRNALSLRVSILNTPASQATSTGLHRVQ